MLTRMYRNIHKDLTDLKYLYFWNNLRISEFQTFIRKDKCQVFIPNADRYKLKVARYRWQALCVLGVAILFNSRIQRQFEKKTVVSGKFESAYNIWQIYYYVEGLQI
jgi:hypothetical protein